MQMRKYDMVNFLFSSDEEDEKESVGASIIAELITTVLFIGFFIGGRIVPALKVFIYDKINTFLIGVCFIFAGITLGVYSKTKSKGDNNEKVSIENISERNKKKIDINKELNKIIVAESNNKIWFSVFLLFFIIAFVFLYIAVEANESSKTTYFILSLFFIVMSIIILYIFKTKKENVKKEFKEKCVYTLLREINPNIRYYRNLTKEGEEEQKRNYIRYNYDVEKVEESNLYDFYLGSSLGENIKIFNISTVDIHKNNGKRMMANFDGLFVILKKNNDIINKITIKTKELSIDKKTLQINEEFNKEFIIYSENPQELEHLNPEIYTLIKAFHDRLKGKVEINICEDAISLKYYTKREGNRLINWIVTNYKQELMYYFAIYKFMMDISNMIN